MSFPPPDFWKRRFFFGSLGLACLLLAIWPRTPSESRTPSVENATRDGAVGQPAALANVDKWTDFEEWLVDLQKTPEHLREHKIEVGVSLAKSRRDAMAILICTQPEEAIARALTPRQRALVPQPIQPFLEREISGSGFYGVLAICHDEDLAKNRIEREVAINEERFKAHVFGQRLVRKTEKDASLSGIALDGHIALREEEVVIRSADQMPPGEVPPGGFAATFRGETSILQDQTALDAFVKKKLTPSELRLAASGPAFDPEQPPTGPAPPTVAYNEYKGSFAHQKGPKTVFVFLIEPSDGAVWTNPPSQSTLEAQLNSASQNYYNVSYKQTWFGPKYTVNSNGTEVLVPKLVVAPVVRLSKTAADLSNDLYSMTEDAKSLLEAMGVEWRDNGSKDPDNFDRLVVMSNSKLITSTGLAFVGGATSWSGGALSGGVAEHEFGHNWGVVHANSWTVPSGAEPRSPLGVNGEYSDGWDIMGGGGMSSGFNTQFQEELGFLERSRGEVRDITSSGTYRLYDYIDPYSRNPVANTRALLIPMSSFTDWKRIFIGFGHITGTDGGKSRSDWNRNALTVHTALSDGSNRIDTTPYSNLSADADDSSIKIGRTYTEGPNVNGNQTYGGFSITPVLRGNTSVNGTTHEWMDVVVNYGAPSPNAPTAQFPSAVYNASPGNLTVLSVNASDSDGDTLAYDWDFGDGNYSILNSPTQSRAWTTAGVYLVTCTVSDMKGRTTTARCWVNVGNQPYRKPVTDPNVLSGWSYRYYEGTFSTMPDFNTLLPKNSGVVEQPTLSVKSATDNFALVFDGYIDVPSTDIYRFRTTSEDGSRLWIGDTLVVDNNSDRSKALSASGNIPLQAGRHKARLEFFHKDGTESLLLEMATRETSFAPIPANQFFRTNPAAKASISIAISTPIAGARFIVNSDILIEGQSNSTVSSVVFFADGSYIGTASTAPFRFTWPKVSVGAKSLTAIAYASDGSWSQSAPVAINVVSPEPRPSIGLNFNTENATGGTMYFSDQSGAVYQQANWNNLVGLSGNLTSVKDYLGQPTTTTVSWTGTANSNYGDGSNNADTTTGPGRMFKGLTEIRGDEAVMPSLSASRVPFLEYDVYVYFDLRASDVKDITPQKFVCVPASGTTPNPIFGKNSLSSNDTVGDYPNYDTWTGFKEATATSASAGNNEMLGNYVVFRGVRSSSFVVRAERQNAATQQKLGFNAVQIVEKDPSGPLVQVQTASANPTVSESGVRTSLAVRLGYPPQGNVTISINPGTQLSSTPSSLIFTPANWNQPQSISLGAIDDTLVEGPHTAQVTFAASAADAYNNIQISPVDVSILDNDQFTVGAAGVGVLRESAPSTGARFQVVRSSASVFSNPLTVAFRLGGTVLAGSDYTVSGSGVAFDTVSGNGTIEIPAGNSQAFIDIFPIDDGLAEGAEVLTLEVKANSAYALDSNFTASLSILDNDAVDYFTEIFTSATDFDLNGSSLTFTPQGSSYSVGVEKVTAFPAGTTSFTNYGNKTDDTFWSQTLAAPFPFFGSNETTAYVGSNGFITFRSGSSSSSSTIENHFYAYRPRIAGITADLDPSQTGNVAYKRVTTTGAARSVFYWNAVRVYGNSTTVSFQIEMFDDGRIRITWLNCAPSSGGLVGLASGDPQTMPKTSFLGNSGNIFYESDLSAYSATTESGPVFNSQPVIQAVLGQYYSYSIIASDADGSQISFTAVEKPSWLQLSATSATAALLQGTPSSSGTFPVTLKVSDGVRESIQTFQIQVVPANGNSKPQFAIVSPGVVSPGQSVQINLQASDVDGQSLKFSILSAPGWLSLVDNGNGTATLSGTAPLTTVSRHPLTISVEDSMESTVQSFDLTLNLPPVITLTSPKSGFLELRDRTDSLVLDALVSDDGIAASQQPTLSWSLVSGPGAVSLQTPSSTKCVANFSSSGWHQLRFQANDGYASSTKDVHVFVENDAEANLSSAIAGWWKFDEGNGTTANDSSGNARNLTLNTVNGTTTSNLAAIGKSGTAYSSDATALQYGETLGLGIPASSTMSAWIYTTASPASADRYLFNFVSGNSSVARIYMASGTSRLRFFSDRTTDGIWEAQRDLNADEWIHVAMSYNSASASNVPAFYINGSPVAVTAIGNSTAAGNQTATTALRVGGGATSSNSWIGRIDDAKVFNRILTPAEVALAGEVSEVARSPIVSSGDPRETRVGSTLTLNGAVDSPQALTLQWSCSGSGTAVFESPGQSQTGVVFSDAGPKVVRLTASDGTVVVFSESLVSVLPLLSNFQSWLGGFSGLGGATAPDADPDGDRIPNLIEYALGGDPLQVDPQRLPRQSMTKVNGLDYLTLSADCNPAATDLTFSVEVSSDLLNWYSGDAYTTVLSAPGDAVFTARDNTPVGSGSSRRFIRLKISKP